MRKNYFVKCMLVASVSILAGHLSAQQDLNKMDEDMKSEFLHPAQQKMAPKSHASLAEKSPAAYTVQGCDTLSTTFAAGNSQNGNMFDITATNAVTINSFDGHLDTVTTNLASDTVFIYYIPSTFVGSNATPSAWTFVGKAHVVSAGIGVPTPISIPVNVTIPAGQTYGFYITRKTISLKYTNGTAFGAVYKSNADIAVKEGNGVAYPFGSIFPSSGTGSRIWNGIVHYCTVTGVEGHLSTVSAVVYPQPMIDEATVKLSGVDRQSGMSLKLFNATGQLVKVSSAKNSEEISINKDQLNNGIYFYQVVNSENKILYTGKLLVQ